MLYVPQYIHFNLTLGWMYGLQSLHGPEEAEQQLERDVHAVWMCRVSDL